MNMKLVEKLAKLIHEEYVEECRKKGQTIETNPSMLPYKELPDDLKSSNMDNASHIPYKMKIIGYKIRQVRKGIEPSVQKFTDAEIEEMARCEHERWVKNRCEEGWVYGPVKDIERKVSPYMIPYDLLKEDIKDYDRQTVRLIPQLLSRAGYEAYKFPY